MEPKRATIPDDRHVVLARAREEVEGELDRLAREEAYLARQIRRAQEQLRYYEQMLVELKRSVARRAPLQELVRRLS
jgi:hypothetical protein